MDVLLSLPIATYLLSPSLTSWSTSLNLLFFYMTWSTVILSHPPLHIHLGGVLALRILLWLLPSLATLLFDVGVPSLAEGIKFGGRSALPPRDAKRLSRMVGLAVLNLGVVTGVEGVATWAVLNVFGEMPFQTSTTLPLPWQIAKHIPLLLALREGLVYYIHRSILHSSSTTTTISTLHTRFSHAHTSSPFSLLLFTDHPLPLLLHRFIPIFLPALLLRPHILTYFFFVALCTAEETLAMSGYSVVPGIIMGGIVRRQAVHYACRGQANYGAWGFLDWFNGTSRGGDVLEDVKAEAGRHDVKGRSRRKASQGAGLLQSGFEALKGENSAGLRRSPRKRTARRLS